MAADVVEITRVSRPPRGREAVPGKLARLLEAHEIVIREVGKRQRQPLTTEMTGRTISS
jgi:hypothetical protein